MLGERTAPAPVRAGSGGMVRRAAVALWTAHWPLLIALGAVAAIGLPTVNFVYGPDQALFVYIGRGLARGQTLYADLWDVKPPGVFWLYALATRIPGGYRAVRAFDLAYALATVAAVYALGRYLWGRGAGTLAGLLYGTVYVTASGYWNMAQPDSFLVLPVVLGVLAWEGGMRGGATRSALAAGLLFGFAFQFRSVMALLPAALALRELWPAMAGREERATRPPGGWQRRRESGRRLAALAGGAALVQLLTLLYLAAGGAVSDYLYGQLRFAGKYVRLGGPYAWDSLTPGSYLSGLRGSVMWFGASRLLLTAPALAALLVGGVLRADRGVRLMALLLATAVLGVAVQAKFFVYHWHVALPFLALLAAWTARETWRELRARFSRRGAVAAAGASVILLLLFTPQVTDPGVREWQDLVWYAVQPSYRDRYYDRFGLRGHGTYSFRASQEVANYIRARTRPGETIFVWGYDPNVYLISGRESASRFLSFLPLMPVFTPERWRQEFVRDLETRRPAYILLQRGENARWITGRRDDSAEWVTRFTGFNDLLTREYELDRRIEDFYIYRRR